MAEITQGTRVRVGSGDGLHDLGEGTYEGEEKVFYAFMKRGRDVYLLSSHSKPDLDETIKKDQAKPGKVEILTEGFQPTPRIKLDSGRIIFGSQCWWEVIPSAA